MINRTKFALWICVILFYFPLCSGAAESLKEIKVFRVGSSSFSYALIEDTRAIVEASGKYKLVCDTKGDQAGYTRLDKFIAQPGSFEEWCEQQIPRIAAGNYDFVIIQTIGWLGFTPNQQDELCTKLIPDLVRRIRQTGARVILYDKYLPVERDQKDPNARTWCLRYPDGYRLNYLLHIMAAKHAGIDGISFGGQAVTQLWQEEHFAKLRHLYCDPGHPGPMANYVSACNLAFLLTGEDPIGSPTRKLPFGEMRSISFERLKDSDRPEYRQLYEENKHRIGDGWLTLSDVEARAMQEAAMKSQRHWGAIFSDCLQNDEEFANAMQEIRQLQGEMDKFEEYGLDEGKVASFKEKYAPAAEPGGLNPTRIKIMRRKIVSIDYSDASIRNYCRRYLSKEKYKAAAEEYARYWLENNSKLRDDIYYECRLLEEKSLRDGKRDEARHYGAASGMIRYVLSLAAWRILLENVDPKQQEEILNAYDVHGLPKRISPIFAAYQNEHHMDREKLFGAWKIYIQIWSDPDLMDKLRDGGYKAEIFLEADREFEQRIAR